MSYRKNDGRYARMFAFWALFLLVAYGCFHGGGLADLLDSWMDPESNQTFVESFPLLGTLKVSTCITLAVWLVVGFLLSMILGRRRIADALIDTEAEMRKVTWPTWPETWNGTLAVVVLVAILFVYLFVVDLGLIRIMMLLMSGSTA